MKIVVIGGTGHVGTQVVSKLKGQGHDVVVAAKSTGVNVLTNEGLDAALAGAEVVIDVTQAPSFEEQQVMHFFGTSAVRLAVAERKAGIKHHVSLSVVGTQLLQGSAYFRAKLVQEAVLRASGIPYTIVRATQFFEFLDAVAYVAKKDDGIHVPPAFIQPIANAEVASFVADVALQAPANDRIDLAGPEKVQISEILARHMKLKNDSTKIIVDPAAYYFGTPLQESFLVPQGDAKYGKVTLEEWAKEKAAAAAKA